MVTDNLQQASQRKLPVIELETFDSQLNGFSSELQEKNLNTALDTLEGVGKNPSSSIAEMAEIWKSGNDEQLLELTNSMNTDPEYQKAQLTDRNIGMANKIDSYLQHGGGKNHFIVVGVAHYLGEDGIVKLLQHKGYTVVRK
ncbi:TraB/GumN family protein [Paenibacillus campi]|uniref:TraB/GumN family protein n=1 Tax=Paenibacillus campi TaxID=3106031 RepID=UPI002AFE2E59|nr:TraB/GumN family protein [Paenibacillus sp. SGZ-1014]